ncbi:MAG: transglutaminase [Pseudomonadota bacterium]
MTVYDAWTDPGPYHVAIAACPDDPAALVDIVQGLLLHDAALALYGLSEADMGPISRETLPVGQRLERILMRDEAPLIRPRPPRQREIGTCRDYALLLTSLLRMKGHEAHLRCGFANYFELDGWEDHWIVEYRSPGETAWRFADAQLDAAHQMHLGLTVVASDLPTGRFLPADRAWVAHRTGKIPAGCFGHGAATGVEMLVVNLARDRLVLGGHVTSDWDTWRDSLPWGHMPGDRLIVLGDCLANGIGEVSQPFWRDAIEG